MFDLDQRLFSLKRRIHRLLGSRIEVIWVRSSQLDPLVGEVDWIEQAILEMTVRARSAMPYGGKLVVEFCNLDVNENAAEEEALLPGRYVMFEMTCVRRHLSDLDWQISYDTDDLDPSPDLWLDHQMVRSREMLQSIGGNVWEYNEPGGALTLRAFLPSAAVITYSDEEGFALTNFSNNNAILVVEDESFVREVACEILQSAGYTVMAARTGKEALAIYEKHGPFRLLVTDVVMPGMNGRDLAARLTSMQPDLKTIYMSGYTENPMLRHDFQATEVKYLQKPFTLESLTSKVREVLEGSAA